MLQDLYKGVDDEVRSHTEIRFSLGWAIHQRGSDYVQTGSLTKVMGLLIRVATRDIQVTEELVMIKSFKNELTRSRRNYLATNFRTSY